MSDKHYVHAPDTTKLEELLKQSRPWFEKYATAMIYGVAAIMAIAAAMIWFNRQPNTNAEASKELMLASNAEGFQDVADRFSGTEIAVMARLRQAEEILDSAISNLFKDRKVGVEELDRAEKAYESLVNRNDLPPAARQRVLVGLARIAECRCDGTDKSVDTAVNAWQRLLDEYKETGIFNDLAEERIADLPLESTRSFYAWFQLQDPKPGDDLPLPQDRPGTVPEIPDLSTLPDLGLDSLIPPNTTPAVVPETTPPETPAESDAGTSTTPEPAASDDAAAPLETPASQPETPAADDAGSPDAPAPKADGTSDETPAASDTPDPAENTQPAGTPDK